jgi:hypothetical protein
MDMDSGFSFGWGLGL